MESNPKNILPEFQYNTNPSGYSPTPHPPHQDKKPPYLSLIRDIYIPQNAFALTKPYIYDIS